MLEHDVVRWEPKRLVGRTKILTNKQSITSANVVDVLSDALALHHKNCGEIHYLEQFYRGVQDVMYRTKEFRENICNTVIVNFANEIVTFKTSYFLGSPIEYVANGGEERVSNEIRRLNEYMRAEDKDSKDKEICDWFHITGVAERLVLPDETGIDTPYNVYTLSPEHAFVIYSSRIGEKPMAGVVVQTDEDNEPYYSVYTKDEYFEVKNGKVYTSKRHRIGEVPLVEYLNNEARIGAFEIVLSILNAINTLESNRIDDIEQFVQSLLVFKNCELTEEDAVVLKQKLGIAIRDVGTQQSDIFRVQGELSQSGVQTLKDNLYESILTICGMPNRNGGSSTSDTGAATQYRDGWVSADSRANDTEKMFNRAEKQFLKAVLNICKNADEPINLKLSNIKIEHTRNNLSNVQSRMQILCEGLNNDKIHPKLPWIMAGIPNAEEWYRLSEQHSEEKQRELSRQLMEEVNADSEGNIRENGQNNRGTEQEFNKAV